MQFKTETIVLGMHLLQDYAQILSGNDYQKRQASI